MKANKTCILILGMHRSGTSAMGNLVDALGYYGGQNLKPAAYDNLKGFYEHEDIVKLNDRLLELIGLRWDNYNKTESIDWATISSSQMRHEPKSILLSLIHI